MPDRVKEKLVELISGSLCRHIHKSCNLAENIADDLITNGVTFAKDNNVPTKLPELPNPTLEEMELSVRCYNVLKRAWIKTAQDVAKLDYAQLIRIRNLGRNTYDEIVGKLEALGYNTEALMPQPPKGE